MQRPIANSLIAISSKITPIENRKDRMNKILITGGAGFIGSAVIRQMITETDTTVINVDKLTYAGNLQSLAGIADNPRYCFEHVDICNAAEVARLFREHQPDGVMHLAAESDRKSTRLNSSHQ